MFAEPGVLCYIKVVTEVRKNTDLRRYYWRRLIVTL